MSDGAKAWGLHFALLIVLFCAEFVLSAYHQGVVARVMVLACFAMGYNVMFGYTGLLSLGHALFFAAGMYGLGLTMRHLGWSPGPALLAGVFAGFAVAAAIGVLALRTVGVGFMIVTLMFAQAGYLLSLYFGEYTRGDEGFVIQAADRILFGLDLTAPSTRYFAAFLLFAACLVGTLGLVRSNLGKTLIAVRENEERARMLGYDTFRVKLAAVVISGTISAGAGATYGLLFGYVGASFAGVQYSIFPLLWVLLGGAGTVIGPFLGTLFMFYLIDLSSEITDAYLLIVGVALVALTLFAPQGLAGELRRKFAGWLP